MAPPDVDDLLRLVKAGVDPTLATKPSSSPMVGLDAENLVRMLAESAADPTGEKAAAAFAAEGELASSAKKRLKKLFAKLDMDGSGSIEMAEFRRLLLSSDTTLLGLPECSLEDIFDAVDTDGDEEVDYNEFLGWLGLGSGRVQAGPMGEQVPMPEVDARADGPSFTSAGSACWQHYRCLAVISLARALGTWRPPDDFDAKMEPHLQKAEKLCLQLGTCEAELRTRRKRACGAVRKWVADNFSMSSKTYMKRVEEVEQRVVNIKATRARLERSPEALEAAQLAGWTHQQQLGQLSIDHDHALNELKYERQKAEKAMERVMEDVTSRLPWELFPQGLEAGPLRQEEAIPGLDCSIVTSLDAVHLPDEGLVLCVDVQLPDERDKKKKKKAEATAPHNVDFLLVLDQSSSMAEELPLIGRAIETLASQLDSSDRLSVIAMGDEARVLLDWTEMTDGGRKEGQACAAKLTAAGGARFLPACETMLLQLKAAQASSQPAQVRQPAALFLSDGESMEARDAIFSFFSRKLSAFPSLLFAPVALGPEADASLMSELGRCLHGPAFYLPDECQIDEVLGQIWAAARNTALLDCRVIVRPSLGCGVAETEDAACPCGVSGGQQDVHVSSEQLKGLFRCVVVLSTESAAFKACKFEGGDGDQVYLKEPLYAGTAGVVTESHRGERLLVKPTQRLIGIRRSTFLPKSKKLRNAPELHFEGEEDDPILRQRPPNRILWTGISRGTVELEFEPLQWCDNNWSLAEDIATDEATLSKGSRLIGYRLGEHGDVQTAEVELEGYSNYLEGGFAVWRMDVFDSLLGQAAGRGLYLCFEAARPCIMQQTGPMQRGGSRQVFCRLRVPKSLSDWTREDEDDSKRLVDVLVVATSAQPDGTSKVIRQRLGLHASQVPSLGGNSARVRYQLKVEDGAAVDEAAFKEALAQAGETAAKDLQVEREQQGSGTTIVAGLGLSGSLRSEGVLAASLDTLISAKTCEGLEGSGFPLQASPTVVGRAALRRFAQWRLSRCLQTAAECGTWTAVQEVRELSKSKAAAVLDPADPPNGGLRSAALEAAAAEAMAAHGAAVGDLRNRLFGLAAAHKGQHPPSVALDAMGLSETEAAWEPAAAPEVLGAARRFMELAGVREEKPEQVTTANFAGADGDSLRIRFLAVGGNGKPVTAYTLSARDTETGEVYQQSTRASSTVGFKEGREYEAAVEGLPSGKPFTVVVFAWNGRRGLPSPPVFCSTPNHALHSRGPGRRAPARLS